MNMEHNPLKTFFRNDATVHNLYHRGSLKNKNKIWEHIIYYKDDSMVYNYHDLKGNIHETVIIQDDCIIDPEAGEISIIFNPKDNIKWRWTANKYKNYITLQFYEKKICKHCDPYASIYKNGMYDYRFVHDTHRIDCPDIDCYKHGLQSIYYYIHYDVKSAIKHPPYIFINTSNIIFKDNSKFQIKEVLKYISKDTYKKDVDFLKKNFKYKELIESIVYKYYFPTKNNIYFRIIKDILKPKRILKIYASDLLSHNGFSKAKLYNLKQKSCLISYLYSDGLLETKDIVPILLKVSSLQQYEIIAYFFLNDEDIGIREGFINLILPSQFNMIFEKMIKSKHYLNNNTCAIIDDILYEYYFN